MNSTIRKIIEEIAAEEGISRPRVEHAIRHFFNWQRQSFIDIDYSGYYWRYFGKFKVIKKKYDKLINNETKTKESKKEESELGSDEYREDQ